MEFSKMDEQKLRELIATLKHDRAAVRTTVLELESVHIDPFMSESVPNPDAQRLDLENAVLMQELMAMKVRDADLTDVKLMWINPLHANFFRGNTNIYSHFISFLHMDMTQVVEILPQVRQEPSYST